MGPSLSPIKRSMCATSAPSPISASPIRYMELSVRCYYVSVSYDKFIKRSGLSGSRKNNRIYPREFFSRRIVPLLIRRQISCVTKSESKTRFRNKYPVAHHEILDTWEVKRPLITSDKCLNQ